MTVWVRNDYLGGFVRADAILTITVARDAAGGPNDPQELWVSVAGDVWGRERRIWQQNVQQAGSHVHPRGFESELLGALELDLRHDRTDPGLRIIEVFYDTDAPHWVDSEFEWTEARREVHAANRSRGAGGGVQR
jgi:hypothetical protein